jgi:hypothetical protein
MGVRLGEEFTSLTGWKFYQQELFQSYNQQNTDCEHQVVERSNLRPQNEPHYDAMFTSGRVV